MSSAGAVHQLGGEIELLQEKTLHPKRVKGYRQGLPMTGAAFSSPPVARKDRRGADSARP